MQKGKKSEIIKGTNQIIKSTIKIKGDLNIEGRLSNTPGKFLGRGEVLKKPF